MSDLLELKAQLTAQNLVIESLFNTLVSSGQVDARSIAVELEGFLDSPKAEWLSPDLTEAVTGEVNVWLNMINDLYQP